MEENLKQLPSGPKRIIKIALFGPESTGKTTLANLSYGGVEDKFTIHFSELDTNFTLVYAFENNDSIQSN